MVLEVMLLQAMGVLNERFGLCKHLIMLAKPIDFQRFNPSPVPQMGPPLAQPFRPSSVSSPPPGSLPMMQVQMQMMPAMASMQPQMMVGAPPVMIQQQQQQQQQLPQPVIRRNTTLRQFELSVQGNLVIDIPVPDMVLEKAQFKKGEEFTHMRLVVG
jgi:hypothetical protein